MYEINTSEKYKQEGETTNYAMKYLPRIFISVNIRVVRVQLNSINTRTSINTPIQIIPPFK